MTDKRVMTDEASPFFSTLILEYTSALPVEQALDFMANMGVRSDTQRNLYIATRSEYQPVVVLPKAIEPRPRQTEIDMIDITADMAEEGKPRPGRPVPRGGLLGRPTIDLKANKS